MTVFLRLRRGATGKGKFRVGENNFNIRALRPPAAPGTAGILGGNSRFDMGMVNNHPQAGDISGGEKMVLTDNSHIVADLEPSLPIELDAGGAQPKVVDGRPPSGREQDFFDHNRCELSRAI